MNSINKEFWYSIKKNNYALPAGYDVIPLTEELYSYIASTDPELRDIIGFFVFKNWLRQGFYSAGELCSFIPRLLANLQKGIEGENDFVYLRSFSALWLAVIVDYDIRKPFLKEITTIKEAAITYFVSERDLRGYDPVKGWAHAIDHAANLLSALACSQHTNAEDHIRMLDGITAKLRDSMHWIYIYDEDDCLADIAVEIFARNTLSEEQVRSWLVNISADWTDSFRDESHARAFFNGRNFLRALHWQMSTRNDIPEKETLQGFLHDTLDNVCRFEFPE